MQITKLGGICIVLLGLLGCSHKVTVDSRSSSTKTVQMSPSSMPQYTMVIKAGSNTIVQYLDNNTSFDITTNKVHLKGMELNGILNMRIGDKQVQLDGSKMKNYHFKNSRINISIYAQRKE